MSNDFQVALDYITLSAAYWDYKVMCMARYVQRSHVNLRPYSEEGLRLVRAVTDIDRRFQTIDNKVAAEVAAKKEARRAGTTPLDRTLEPSLPWQLNVYGKKARRQSKKA